jgi:hypothetical protein
MILTNISLTKPETNLVNKLVDDYGLVVLDNDLTVQNMCSGQDFTANSPLSAALVRFLNTSYRNYSLFGKMTFNAKPVAINTYDRVKYLVLKIDREIYYSVID